jgi:hypothetical protein
MIYLYAPNQIIGTIYKSKLLKGRANEQVLLLTSYEGFLGLDPTLVFMTPGWDKSKDINKILERLASRSCVVFELQHVYG